jgi:hypothetical protein
VSAHYVLNLKIEKMDNPIFTRQFVLQCNRVFNLSKFTDLKNKGYYAKKLKTFDA